MQIVLHDFRGIINRPFPCSLGSDLIAEVYGICERRLWTALSTKVVSWLQRGRHRFAGARCARAETVNYLLKALVQTLRFKRSGRAVWQWKKNRRENLKVEVHGSFFGAELRREWKSGRG